MPSIMLWHGKNIVYKSVSQIAINYLNKQSRQHFIFYKYIIKTQKLFADVYLTKSDVIVNIKLTYISIHSEVNTTFYNILKPEVDMYFQFKIDNFKITIHKKNFLTKKN